MKSTNVILFAGSALAVAPLLNDTTWLYQGCYSAPAGHMLDMFRPQNLSDTSIRSCLDACASGKKRYASLGAANCYCASELIATLMPNADETNCTIPCGRSGADACGGPINPDTNEPVSLSLYDSSPPVPVSVDDWTYRGCVPHVSDILKFIHTATVGSITVERCLGACDVNPTAYTYAGVSGDSCYCGNKSLMPEKNITFVDNDYTTCNYPCPGNPAEACGGSFRMFDPAISFYEREGGASQASVIDASSTGMLMTRTIPSSSATATATLDREGNSDEASRTMTGGSSTETKKSSAGSVRVGGEIMAGVLGLLAVL